METNREEAEAKGVDFPRSGHISLEESVATFQRRIRRWRVLSIESNNDSLCQFLCLRRYYSRIWGGM